MAPDFETSGEKVEKSPCDVTQPEINGLSESLNFQAKSNIHFTKEENVNGLQPDPNSKMEKEKDGDDGIPDPEIQIYPPGQVCLEWTKTYRVGAGLVNLGNTCFLNTVIQCLTYCPPLANYLLQGDHSESCKSFEFCMMCELQKHTKQVFQRSGDVIKPHCIYQNLKYIADHFQFGQQEDAHEFLRFVIDNLWRSSICSHPNDDKLDPASRETTIINHIFGGYNRSQVVCRQCNLKSDKYEHFMDFILDIQSTYSLEKAVEQFVKPEVLENENAYKCPKCNALVPAEKTFTIHRPPNVATFQLKRFDYSKSYGKITKHVSYPENFDLRPYMSQKKGDSLLYKLNAVLVHVGQNCNSGHYYCYIRNSNGYWYLMDDAKVQRVSLHDVLNQQAYVLFYIKSSNSGIHFKKNGITPVMNFQHMSISSDDGIMSELSSPRKSQSSEETSDESPKSSEKGSSSAMHSPSSLSSKTSKSSSTQSSFSRLNGSFNHSGNYNRGHSDSKYSRAFKRSYRKSPYTSSDRYSAYNESGERAPSRNLNVQYESGSSDEGYHSSQSRSSRPSSYEKYNSGEVGAYNGHNSVYYRSYTNNSHELDRNNMNSFSQFKRAGEDVSHYNVFYENNHFSTSNETEMYRDQYARGNSTNCSSNYFCNDNQWFYNDTSERLSGTTQKDHSTFQRECNINRNNYSNENIWTYRDQHKYCTQMNGYVPQSVGIRDHQSNNQFSSAHYKNDFSARNICHQTFVNNKEQRFSEPTENGSKHFHERFRKKYDFGGRFFRRKGFGNNHMRRKKNFVFPNTKSYEHRNHQGKLKHSEHYNSCRMAHTQSSSFLKYKNSRHSYPPHDKCFYLNVC